MDNDDQDGGFARNSDNLPPGEDPRMGAGALPESSEDIDIEGMEDDDSVGQAEDWFLRKARSMYTYSTDYLESNITNTWEKNLAHFNNQHAPGTPYTRAGFKRSRLFRPKTRSNVKTSEAAFANAAFSTLSLAAVTAQNERDPKQVLSAAINQELLQYRLDNTIPWYLTAVGAYQSTKVYGVCVSYQHWVYREDTDVVPAIDEYGDVITEEIDGEFVPMGREERIVREDRLACDNFPPENFRFDPMCDWRDPANTSPYLVALFPIYAGEAMEMMEMVDPKTGKSTWRKYAMSDIMATRKQGFDRTRQAREGRERIDPADDQADQEFTTLWAHMNIVKINGTDVVYWTMGTELLLTDPVPLMDEYPWLREGERPFVVGTATVEAHRNYPAGDVEQSAGLQEEINSVANQRSDNVKLVLNKRHFVRRGAQVDLDALVRNVPGGGVMMNDPERDVKIISTPDVTGSSYREQDILASEFDDLVGNFTPGGSENKNASVGGLSMMGSAANAVQDLGMKTFIETWMEPVLKQLVRLEQMYETDEALLALAGERAQAFEKYGVDQLTDDLLTQNLTVRVNVGMGNTDPMRRVERLVYGIGKAAELPGQVERLKANEVTNEIFGALGYKDGSRFFMTDAEHEEFMAQQPEPGPTEEELRSRELDIRQEENHLRHQREQEKLQKQQELEYSKLAEAAGLKTNELQQKLGVEEMKDKTQRDAVAFREMNKVRELNVKETTGSGI